MRPVQLPQHPKLSFEQERVIEAIALIRGIDSSDVEHTAIETVVAALLREYGLVEVDVTVKRIEPAPTTR